MATLPENSVDTVITDPPYGLIFMGRDWDRGVPGKRFWSEALRVAKPGAMLLAFGGTRTHHRLMVAIEDAGWEIRDVIMWLYGSGFPKSHDISKAIDKAAGALGVQSQGANYAGGDYEPRDKRFRSDYGYVFTPATDAAQTWQGWGTALKPSYEPVIMAMKPLDGTFAQNAARHGVAGLNIDGARIGQREHEQRTGAKRVGSFGGDAQDYVNPRIYSRSEVPLPPGRWPANLILDEEAAEGQEWARYFYCAKASRREREAGLEDVKTHGTQGARPGSPDPSGKFPDHDHRERGGNNHPTVKPLSLMRYLVRLTSTPTGGVVLDPFMGSGTTGIAALQEGRKFIGIELDADYFKIAEKRIANAVAQPTLVTAMVEIGENN